MWFTSGQNLPLSSLSLVNVESLVHLLDSIEFLWALNNVFQWDEIEYIHLFIIYFFCQRMEGFQPFGMD